MGPKCNPIYPYKKEAEGDLKGSMTTGMKTNAGSHEQLKEARNSFSPGASRERKTPFTLDLSVLNLILDFWSPEL